MGKLADLFPDAPLSTGHDRRWSARVLAGGTVSMHRGGGDARCLSLLALGDYREKATTPAEPGSTSALVLPIWAHVVLDADEAGRRPAVEWSLAGGNVRVMTESIAVVPTIEGDFDVRERNDDEGAGNDLDLVRRAREMAATAPAVDVDRPVAPELGDDQVENARRLFGLTVAQLADLLGVTERQMYRYTSGAMPQDRRETLNALVATGLLLAGGLDTDGRWEWLAAGVPSSAQLLREGRSREVRERAGELQDSIAS